MDMMMVKYSNSNAYNYAKMIKDLSHSSYMKIQL